MCVFSPEKPNGIILWGHFFFTSTVKRHCHFWTLLWTLLARFEESSFVPSHPYRVLGNVVRFYGVPVRASARQWASHRAMHLSHYYSRRLELAFYFTWGERIHRYDGVLKVFLSLYFLSQVYRKSVRRRDSNSIANFRQFCFYLRCW